MQNADLLLQTLCKLPFSGNIILSKTIMSKTVSFISTFRTCSLSSHCRTSWIFLQLGFWGFCLSLFRVRIFQRLRAVGSLFVPLAELTRKKNKTNVWSLLNLIPLIPFSSFEKGTYSTGKNARASKMSRETSLRLHPWLKPLNHTARSRRGKLPLVENPPKAGEKQSVKTGRNRSLASKTSQASALSNLWTLIPC